MKFYVSIIFRAHVFISVELESFIDCHSKLMYVIVSVSTNATNAGVLYWRTHGLCTDSLVSLGANIGTASCVQATRSIFNVVDNKFLSA